jgi:hypothetical protein
MAKQTLPSRPKSGLGLTTHVENDSYPKRGSAKPIRNRNRVMSNKPARVAGRKRGG